MRPSCWDVMTTITPTVDEQRPPAASPCQSPGQEANSWCLWLQLLHKTDGHPANVCDRTGFGSSSSTRRPFKAQPVAGAAPSDLSWRFVSGQSEEQAQGLCRVSCGGHSPGSPVRVQYFVRGMQCSRQHRARSRERRADGKIVRQGGPPQGEARDNASWRGPRVRRSADETLPAPFN